MNSEIVVTMRFEVKIPNEQVQAHQEKYENTSLAQWLVEEHINQRLWHDKPNLSKLVESEEFDFSHVDLSKAEVNLWGMSVSKEGEWDENDNAKPQS